MVFPSANLRTITPMSNRGILVLCAALQLTFGSVNDAGAQTAKPTPWQSAPALPAQLPAGATPANGVAGSGVAGSSTAATGTPQTNRIVSLPAPPPKGSRPNTAPLGAQATPGVRPPAQSPLQQSPAQQPAPLSNTTPATNATPQGVMLPPLPVGPVSTGGDQPQLNTIPIASTRPFGNGLPSGPVAPTPEVNAPVTQETPLKAGELVAVVGTEHILAGDMSVFVDPIIDKNRDKIQSKAIEEQLRTQLTRQVLKQYIEIKAMYLEFFRDMVGNKPPSEIAAMREQVITRATKIFYEKQVPTLYERYEVQTPVELEQKLADKSLSLATMRTQFIEQVLSAEYENKYIPRRFEISRQELLDYYRAHHSEWNMKARAKWREITIRFSNHDEATAQTLIQNLYQQIYLGGKSFEAVAQQSSEGFTASKGGLYDWTTQGSLKSKVIDQAIFTQPLKRLSPIIKDDVGLHIIEVLEREDAHVKSFPDAQDEIREIISRQKRDEAKQKLRDKVLKRTPVWTLWPEDLEDLPRVRGLSRVVDIQ